MQMIDVLKRLAELDAQNPNIVKENQIGTMGLDAYPDEIARMRKSREKMDKDTEWLLKNKPTDPCSKCGESSTYRDSYGTTQYMKCARCGKVRLSSDDIPQNQDMSEGSRTAKPGEHVPLNDPKRKADADAQRAKMAADKAAEPGKKLAAKIAAKEGVAEGSAHGYNVAKWYEKNGDQLKLTRWLRKEAGLPKDAPVYFDDADLVYGDKTIVPGALVNPKLKFNDLLTALTQATGGQGVAEGLEECGMIGGMSPQPHSPASINMTAATGEELSAMLKDIMTLAGRPADDEPMGGPMGGADGIAVVDTEPGHEPEIGADEPSIMRSMLDKLNPETDDGEEQDDEEKVDEYDNTPNPEIAGYDASVPSGNDLHKEKSQYPAAQRGDNPMAATFESLMADYRKFVAESEQGVSDSDDDLVGMIQSTIEDILSGAQRGQDMTDNIADELGDHFDAVQNSGDETLQQAYSMVRDAADTSPEEQAQAAQSALEMLSSAAEQDVDEGSEDMSPGQQMARDGITYSPEKEKELINLMGDYMKRNGMSPKHIRYYLNYDEDFIPDQLSYLPKAGDSVAEGSGPKEKQHDTYVDRNSPESRDKVQAAKDKMAKDKAAEPGKKLADKIDKKSDATESLDILKLAGLR